MRRVGIRSLNGKLFQEAAAAGEMIGVTNDRHLAAVLLPITPGWVDQVVQDHFSRLFRSIESGERQLAEGKPLPTLDGAQFPGGPATLPISRRVSIRELNGDMLEDAAEQGDILGVLNNGQLSAVLVPVTPAWVDRLIDYNVSRLMQSVEWGEKTIEAREPLRSFDRQTAAI